MLAEFDDRAMDAESWRAYGLELERRLELPLRGLRELNELRASLDRVERQLVLLARTNRSSWEEIGRSLGISRQAARSRHRPFVNLPAGDSPRPFA